MFLSIFIIRENEKYKNQKGMASLILVLILTIDACSIQTLYNNIIIGPKLLEEESNRLPIAQKEFESLVSSFRYMPEYGDEKEDLNIFVEDYYRLNSEIEFLNEDIIRNQERMLPTFEVNKLCRFLIDFGIFSGKILESMN